MVRKKKDFLVIGMGRFGTSVARTLMEQGHDVLVVDTDEEKIRSISDEVTQAVQADASEETVLRSLGVSNFDVAIVAIGHNVHANIMATLMVKELGVPQVVAKARDDLHGKILHKIGADRVIFPERDMGLRLAMNLTAPNFVDFLELAPDYSIVEIKSHEEWWGRSLGEIDFRRRYRVNVVAICRGENINPAPMGEDKIQAGDILVLIGHNGDLEKMER